MGWREADELEYSAMILLEEQVMPTVKQFEEELRHIKKFIWVLYPNGMDVDRYNELTDPNRIVYEHIQRKMTRIATYLDEAKRQYNSQITGEDLATIVR